MVMYKDAGLYSVQQQIWKGIILKITATVWLKRGYFSSQKALCGLDEPTGYSM